MKNFAPFLALSMILASCSEHPAPSHPNAGLRIYSNGHESATTRFYTRANLANGLQATITSNKMDYSEGGHVVYIEWTPNFASSMPKDSYHFSISVDGLAVTSFKTIQYSGTRASGYNSNKFNWL